MATTTAIIAGTLTTSDNRRIVIISSLVALLVQAFNSAMTHITTSYTDKEIDSPLPDDSIKVPLAEAGLQFGMHVIASLLVLMPIVFMTDLREALIVSVASALILLLLLGFTLGMLVKHQPVRNGVQTMTLGAMVIAAGFIAGLIIQA